jgi:hypothetical protein
LKGDWVRNRKGEDSSQEGIVKSLARCRGVEEDRPVEVSILDAAGHATHMEYPGAAIAKSNSTGSI